MRLFFKFLGIIFVILSCAYVVKHFIDTNALSILKDRWHDFIWIIVLGSFIYLAANFALSLAWCDLLKLQEDVKISNKKIIAIHAFTQIGKYLPGNVMHFIGRYAATKRAGASHKTLLLANTMESICLVFIGGIITTLGSFTLIENFTGYPPLNIFYVISLLIITGILIFSIVCYSSKSFKKWLMVTIIKLYSIRIIRIICYYILFFIIGGIISYELYKQITPINNISFISIVSVMSLSWVIGYVTPGASAGIGVREAIFTILLSDLTAGVAPLIAVCYRIITIFGDLIYFLFGFVMRQVSERQ